MPTSPVTMHSLLERARRVIGTQQSAFGGIANRLHLHEDAPLADIHRRIDTLHEQLLDFIKAVVPTQDPRYVAVSKAIGVAREQRAVADGRRTLLDSIARVFEEPGIGSLDHNDLPDAVANLRQREKTYFNQRNAARLEHKDKAKLDRVNNVNETLKKRIEQLEQELRAVDDLRQQAQDASARITKAYVELRDGVHDVLGMNKPDGDGVYTRFNNDTSLLDALRRELKVL